MNANNMNAILVLGEDLRTLEKVGVSADDIARLIHEAVTSTGSVHTIQ